jgi:hypothetical protein
VEWNATLVPKYEMGKARALIARFEAQLRAQGRQRGRKGRERHPLLKASKKAITGARATSGTQQRKGEVDLESRYQVDCRYRPFFP